MVLPILQRQMRIAVKITRLYANEVDTSHWKENLANLPLPSCSHVSSKSVEQLEE